MAHAAGLCHAPGARGEVKSGRAPARSRAPPATRSPISRASSQAQASAPSVEPTIIAGICQLQSRFAPSAIELFSACSAIDGYSEPVRS